MSSLSPVFQNVKRSHRRIVSLFAGLVAMSLLLSVSARSQEDQPDSPGQTEATHAPEWAPLPSAIGAHPEVGTNGLIKTPTVWLPDGRLTSPIDQTVENPKSEVAVAPKQEVSCVVEEAQDWDTLSKDSGAIIASDGPLSYTWTATAESSSSQTRTARKC